MQDAFVMVMVYSSCSDRDLHSISKKKRSLLDHFYRNILFVFSTERVDESVDDDYCSLCVYFFCQRKYKH